jgi:hypothetical protein
MNNYISHAMREFRACGWLDEKENFNDGMQEAICSHVMKLLDVFADEGHSGSSAPYAIGMFEKLANFKPLAPLTGEDWEWYEYSPGQFQNIRCGHVFKDKARFGGKAYDSQGLIFWEWAEDEKGEKFKSTFLCADSCVVIKFPYTPKSEYKERLNGD